MVTSLKKKSSLTTYPTLIFVIILTTTWQHNIFVYLLHQQEICKLHEKVCVIYWLIPGTQTRAQHITGAQSISAKWTNWSI